jgi:hypothetical protein
MPIRGAHSRWRLGRDLKIELMWCDPFSLASSLSRLLTNYSATGRGKSGRRSSSRVHRWRWRTKGALRGVGEPVPIPFPEKKRPLRWRCPALRALTPTHPLTPPRLCSAVPSSGADTEGGRGRAPRGASDGLGLLPPRRGARPALEPSFHHRGHCGSRSQPQ